MVQQEEHVTNLMIIINYLKLLGSSPFYNVQFEYSLVLI